MKHTDRNEYRNENVIILPPTAPSTRSSERKRPLSLFGHRSTWGTTILAMAILLPCIAHAKDNAKKDQNKQPQPSPLDVYIEDAHKRAANSYSSPGSLFTGPAVLGDLAADVRARSIDDMVTIVVNEQANAVSVGQTKTSRTSSANASITSAMGQLSPTSRFTNLWGSSGSTALDGEGTTSRQTILTAVITTRVVDVLPNGYLVIEGTKNVMVNSENQVITVRGVVRPADLSNGNTVQSGSVAELELKINGKGVVNDAIRRPNFLYRLLLGLLPF